MSVDSPGTRGVFSSAAIAPRPVQCWPRVSALLKATRLTSFKDLGLAEPILQTLAKEGYTTPTPIQERSIPSILEARDLLGIAQTGTGKTAAFALPILHRLSVQWQRAPRGGCRVLVLSPTRELASQIAASFRTYGAGLGITVATVFGGVSARPQAQALARGVDVLVATPGRLVDHMETGIAVLDKVEILVLDEVDQMLDMGFIKPLRFIVAKMPKGRQNLFFSATMPKEIGTLAGELLRNPVQVSVAPVSSTAERVAQQVIFVEANRKREILVDLFADPAMARTIVFTRTKHGADRVMKYLEAAGVMAQAIHGNKSQAQREKALAAFKAGKLRALVATDIAARGIDVDSVSHVVNYELPEVPENYVHRIGRTARAGAEGIAISLCDHEERLLLKAIEKVTRQSIPSTDRRQERKPGDPSDKQAREALDRREKSHAPRRGGPAQNKGGRPGGQKRDQNRDQNRDRNAGGASKPGQRRPANKKAAGRPAG